MTAGGVMDGETGFGECLEYLLGGQRGKARTHTVGSVTVTFSKSVESM